MITPLRGSSVPSLRATLLCSFPILTVPSCSAPADDPDGAEPGGGIVTISSSTTAETTADSGEASGDGSSSGEKLTSAGQWHCNCCSCAVQAAEALLLCGGSLRALQLAGGNSFSGRCTRSASAVPLRSARSQDPAPQTAAIGSTHARPSASASCVGLVTRARSRRRRR